MKRILGASAFALAALTQVGTVHASDTYPDRPIRWVVPYPAGAPTDTVARKLADVMSKKTGWKIYIENKTGAAGTIGAADVARSPGDGYSFLVSTGDALVANAVSMKSVTYDPKKDFALVSQIGSAGYVMLVGPQLGVNTLSELIAKVRSTPAGWNVGVTGPASPQNLITRALAKKTGISLNTVPYQGSAPAAFSPRLSSKRKCSPPSPPMVPIVRPCCPTYRPSPSLDMPIRCSWRRLGWVWPHLPRHRKTSSSRLRAASGRQWPIRNSTPSSKDRAST